MTPPDDGLNLGPVTTTIKATIEKLQPMKRRSARAAEAEALLQRCLADIQAMVAGSWPPSTPPSPRGTALGDIRKSPAAASIQWEGVGDGMDAGRSAAPSVATHGSGGGGFDETARDDVAGASNAPSMSTHGSGGGGRD